MGWFSNIWNGIKNIGGKVLDGAKFVGGKLSGAFNTVKDLGSKLTSIPIVGDALRVIGASPIGRTIVGGFNAANNVIQRGNDILQNAGGGI